MGSPALDEEARSMSLTEEVEAKRQNIRSDGYAMSIGELSNLYRDEELIIRPEYQRLFRWGIEKKARLIESILLGIPLPSVFVSQRQDGVWEIVDGLQRVSTILEFMGELRNEATGEILPASQMVATKYLPSLDRKYYNSDDSENSLAVSERLAIKRAKLDVKILQKESDDSVKYELFDRLNSGGQPTSAQEVRTAQLLMTHPEFFKWLDGLRNSSTYQDCLPLTQRHFSEQYDLELVIRFLVLTYSTVEALRGFTDVDTFLTDQAVVLAEGRGRSINRVFSETEATSLFARTFALLAEIGIDSFRRYDSGRKKTTGGFTVSSFEAVTVGVAANIDAWENVSEDVRLSQLLEKIQSLASEPNFRRSSGAGVRATQRIPVMVTLGRRHFRP